MHKLNLDRLGLIFTPKLVEEQLNILDKLPDGFHTLMGAYFLKRETPFEDYKKEHQHRFMKKATDYSRRGVFRDWKCSNITVLNGLLASRLWYVKPNLGYEHPYFWAMAYHLGIMEEAVHDYLSDLEIQESVKSLIEEQCIKEMLLKEGVTEPKATPKPPLTEAQIRQHFDDVTNQKTIIALEILQIGRLNRPVLHLQGR